MKFVSLLLLTSILAPLTKGAAVQSDKIFDLSPEEWKAKWDAWPSRTESDLRKRMFSRRDDVLVSMAKFLFTYFLINP